MKTTLFAGFVGFAAIAGSASAATLIGIGSAHPGGGVDGPGDRMNIENAAGTFPTLAAGTYNVTDFEYRNSTDTGNIQPFLSVNTGGNNYTVIWVGPTAAAPGSNGVVTTPYGAGTQQFTLGAPAAVYAGFNAAGPNVYFGAGTTDHNNPSDFSIVPTSTISAWTNPNLGRSYAFEINVDLIPEPSTFGLLGLAGLGLIVRRRR